MRNFKLSLDEFVIFTNIRVKQVKKATLARGWKWHIFAIAQNAHILNHA